MKIEELRKKFPALDTKVYGRPLVYLDNAATSQRPEEVVSKVSKLALESNANIHRAVHRLAAEATDEYESTRDAVRSFLNAGSREEIIFTSGTTASINLVAFSFGEAFVGEGDEIIVTESEHHSNIVPWQMLCSRKKAILKVLGVDDEGHLKLSDLPSSISSRTRLVAVTQISNVLGIINPVKEIVSLCHSMNCPVLVDGAQGAVHQPLDVTATDCDFYAFSGHKLYAATGTGVLYGKRKWLDLMVPYQGGGEMIGTVTFEKTTYAELPFKFEAGTPDYVATHGLARAIDYMLDLGIDNIAAHERELTRYAMERMQQIPGMKIFGTAPDKDAVISFLVGDIHHLDMGTLLDRLGIAVRTGHHCAEPLMHRLGIQGTVRASFALYNTKEEIDTLVAGIERVSKMF